MYGYYGREPQPVQLCILWYINGISDKFGDKHPCFEALTVVKAHANYIKMGFWDASRLAVVTSTALSSNTTRLYAYYEATGFETDKLFLLYSAMASATMLVDKYACLHPGCWKCTRNKSRWDWVVFLLQKLQPCPQLWVERLLPQKWQIRFQPFDSIASSWLKTNFLFN